MKPVDLLSLLFLVLFSAITLLFVQFIPHWKWLIMRFGLLMSAIVLLAGYAKKSNTWKPGLYLYLFLPVFIVPVVFDSLGDMIPWLGRRSFDDVLIRIDYALFGVHPTVWMERFIYPALTNVLQFAYISYYFIPLSLGVTLVLRKREDEFDVAIFGIVLCFYLSYLGYVLFPAIGPRFTLSHLQTADLQAGPVTMAIQETLNRLENTKTDAFPSGHTAVALMTLYYAWKSREMVLAAVLFPVVTGLIVSTMYLRYHYVIDVMAGILLALFTIWLAPKAYKWLGASPGTSHQ